MPAPQPTPLAVPRRGGRAMNEETATVLGQRGEPAP